MNNKRLDLETSMVAPVLRDKLFRVNPEQLIRDFQPMGELDEEDISEIVETLCVMGFLTPVLIDRDNVIIAGQGLADAAMQTDLEDIPALRLDDLDAEERKTYFLMMHHFFKISELDPKIFRIEAQLILSFTASGRLALEIQNSSAGAALI